MKSSTVVVGYGVNVYFFKVGANWVHFANMDETSEHPIEDMVRDANLEFVSDGYGDYMFRENGKDVTEEADAQFEHLEEAINGTVQMALRKIEEHEPDVNYRVGLALNGWRPSKE